MALGTLDIVLLVISLVLSAGIGVYHGIKGIRATPTDYLLGGRAMSPLPLAMSLTVGTLSAITIMGNAGEMYTNGTQLWLMDIGMAFGMFVVAKVFLPIFYPLKMISLYHYIEYRFNSVWLRRTSVVLTLAGAYLFIGFLLFPPSLFLRYFTGVSMTTNIIITGLACSIYSSVGGVKAVVYTDVLQSIIMIIGSLTIVIQGAAQVGGLERAWAIAYERGRIEFFNMSIDPNMRHSFWLVITYGFFFSLSVFGVNQSQTQRTFSTGSVKKAQKVVYYAIFGVLVLKSLINLSGIVIFAVFADCDPLTEGGGKQINLAVTVKYVLVHLTKIPGLAGLFVASIYAAVLSSVSTQVNSMTALIWEDFLKYLTVFDNWSEIKIARLQKLIVLFTGIIGIFMSLAASEFQSFLSTLLQLTGAVGGPMLGLFLVAVYLPWVNIKGATSGFCLAIIVSSGIVIGQLATQNKAEYLPLSRDGCPAPVVPPMNQIFDNIAMTFENETMESLQSLNETFENVTINSIATLLLNNETLTNQTNTAEGLILDESSGNINRGVGIFGVSYCLNYCWGVIVCLLTSIIVTAITGANTPEDVDSKLIAPTSWRIFTMGIKPYMKSCFRSRAKSRNITTDTATTNQEELKPLRKENPQV